MTDLSTMFREIVDQSVSVPPPLDELVGRVRRHRVRRVMGATGGLLAVVLVAFGPAILANDSDGDNVRVAASGARKAAYEATAEGGYEATGRWSLSIERDGKTLVFSNEVSPSCGAKGLIQPGDRVFAEIRSDDSSLKVGADAHCRDSESR